MELGFKISGSIEKSFKYEIVLWFWIHEMNF